ncbi:MAG: hypothetical protein ACU0CY_12340 [Maritimibacter harenae]
MIAMGIRGKQPLSMGITYQMLFPTPLEIKVLADQNENELADIARPIIPITRYSEMNFFAGREDFFREYPGTGGQMPENQERFNRFPADSRENR